MKILCKMSFIGSLSLGIILTGCESLVDQAIRRDLATAPLAQSLDEGIHVVLCGTGTPKASERGQACTAVIAGNQTLLFDAGEGASINLSLVGIPPKSVSSVFITHWHSDHFSGLAQLINTAWINGRKDAIPIYGPAGIERVIAAIADTYTFDINNRRNNRPNLNNDAFAGAPRPIADESQHVLYEKAGVTVSAFAVDHNPVHPAYGYRIDYKGRSVVISGDTRVTEATARAAANVDILVHEALNTSLTNRAIQQMTALGLSKQAKHTSDVIDYHADTIAIAKMAQASGVKHLVLTHLIPTVPNNVFMRWLFVDGMKNHFDGKITVGHDGQILFLPTSETTL
ncbi:MAG: ribonuclease Z [Zhongshania sp.]|jgi:ribonuclease Z